MPFSDTATIESYVPSGDRVPLAERLRGDHDAMNAVDWLWRNFLSDRGEGLYTTLVEPITGDFNRIAENGKAWGHISAQFQNLSKNLTDNTHTLLTQHWTRGSAADAYQGYVEINWVGALFVAEELSTWMGKGFDKLSEWSVNLAESAVNLLETIIERAIKLARKFVPAIGQACAAWDWITSGFEDFPYWSDAHAIIGMVDEVLTLHTRLQELVHALQAYFEAYRGVLDAVGTIPETNSTENVAEITKTVLGGKAEIEESKGIFEEKRSALEGQLSSIDSRLNPQPNPTQ